MKVKAKVLFTYYSDGSGIDIVRVYLENGFEQAKSDFEIMQRFSDSRVWKLEDSEIFGYPNSTYVTPTPEPQNPKA